MDSEMSVPVPPGGPLEVVFSFDTTGSMYSWLDELRGRIQDMIQRLQADIPGIKIAVMAHGDYCDARTYVTKWVDFTANVAELCDFVKTVDRTGGGDAPECYELVLRQVHDELSWTPGSRRALVLIGDNNPHEPNESCNKDKIDWRAETQKLAIAGVTIYGVQCGSYSNADRFYKTISMATMGKHLRLEDFGSLFDTLMAVCYREGNDTAMLANYEKEVRGRCGGTGLAMDIDAIFASLRDDGVDDSASSASSSSSSAVAAHGFGITKPKPKPAPVKATKKLTTAAKATLSKAGTPSPKFKSPNPTVRVARRPRKSPATKLGLGLKKFRQENLPLLKRENVPENNFSLRSLKWSPWTLAMVSSEDVPAASKSLWEKRVGRPGYRLKKLPATRSATSLLERNRALFEVAVQGPGSNKRRHVVFSTFSARCLGAKRWERRLLGAARSQVDRILGAGCKVFIRYCLVVPQTGFVSARRDIQRYDYAWRKLRNVRASARDVTKGAVSISKSDV